MFSKEVFGQRIMEQRKKYGETQKELAQLLGLGTTQITGVEHGRNSTTAERISMICEHYRISADYLLGLTDDPTPKWAEVQTEDEPVRIILASQSPRRRELLHRIGIQNFEVRPAQGEETAPPGLAPGELVERLSRQKAAEIAAYAPEALVIAADTVVEAEGKILGKPHSEAQAAEMLALLSGNTHRVYTGLTVCQGEKSVTQHEITAVRFRPLSKAEITAYIATGEPMDKAGAYGVQGLGAALVERIEGDYFNVVGLPLCRLAGILAQFGVDPLKQ